MSENGGSENNKGVYIGNIWGRKWTVIALVIILVVMGIATCRYLVLKPDKLIVPDEIEDFDEEIN